MKPLKFDPAKVNYFQRMRCHPYTRKDGARHTKKSGPYWYAQDLDLEKGMVTYYIGKELPEECIPYVPASAYTGGIFTAKVGPKPQPRRGASDTFLEALDKGEQVVIDLHRIAKDCNAYVDRIGNGKYLLYRDPKGVE